MSPFSCPDASKITREAQDLKEDLVANAWAPNVGRVDQLVRAAKHNRLLAARRKIACARLQALRIPRLEPHCRLRFDMSAPRETFRDEMQKLTSPPSTVAAIVDPLPLEGVIVPLSPLHPYQQLGIALLHRIKKSGTLLITRIFLPIDILIA